MISKIEEIEEMPICNTCKSQIDFLPYRTVTIKNHNFRIKELYFHYFFPCWDMNYFMQSHEDCRIVSVGFSCAAKILEKPLIIRNMEKNLDLWI